MEWNCRLELQQRKEDGAGGHLISLMLRIENTSAERKEETLCLQTPLEARPFGLREIEIKLGPGEYLELPMEFTFSCGGCHLFLGWVKGMQERYLWKWPDLTMTEALSTTAHHGISSIPVQDLHSAGQDATRHMCQPHSATVNRAGAT